MPTEPGYFREAYARCDWIFDFFAHGFDFLNGRFFPPQQAALDADWEKEEDDVRRRNLVSLVANGDGVIPVELRRYLRLPGDDTELESPGFCLRLYCALSAIDRAVSDLNYLAAFVRPMPGRWEAASEHIHRHHQQLQRSAPGHVVFRPRDFDSSGKTWHSRTLASGLWTEIPTRGVDLRDYFQNLLRADAASDCTVEIRVVSSAQEIEMDSTEFRVGVVPLVETLKTNATDAQLMPGPLRLVKEASSEPAFGIRVDPPKDPARPCEELCERAEAALRYLAGRGAQIVLFPEMVVPDPVLERLREVLFALTDSGQPRPALILAGSFSRMSSKLSSTPPFNVAVVLNGRGEELWRQSKLQPYEMKRYEQKLFGLEKILDSESCREYIEFAPRRLRFVDSRQTGLRMVALICEDATRAPGVRIAKELRANLILVPVMAGPLTNDCGFAANLDPIVNEYDAIFVVANSGPLARAAWKDTKTGPPLAIVGIPLVLPTNAFKTHKLLHETISVPGSSDIQVLYYQLPEA